MKCFGECLKNVAAGVSPAVEGGILPPGDSAKSSARLVFSGLPAGQDAQLYSRRDACCYRSGTRLACRRGRRLAARRHCRQLRPPCIFKRFRWPGCPALRQAERRPLQSQHPAAGLQMGIVLLALVLLVPGCTTDSGERTSPFKDFSVMNTLALFTAANVP